MPRAKKKKSESSVTEPTPLSAALEQSPALAVLRASQDAKAGVEPERPMPEPEEAIKAFLDHQQRRDAISHVERVQASRPRMQDVPAGFNPGPVFLSAGIRVNKGIDRQRGAAAIQFSNERPLSREAEYELMTMLQDAGFQYQVHSRQWVKPYVGAGLGDNTIEARRLAERIAAARGEGRGRSGRLRDNG